MVNHNKPYNLRTGSSSQKQKFGTFQGVFIPSVLTIFGVIMYLRTTWLTGNSGLWSMILIVTMSTSITFLTALSISATATNMKVKAGGAYYMISRSFGLEAGSAIGIPLYLAQTLGVSFYLTGFAESVKNIFPELSIQVIALISLVLLTLLAYSSANLALKTQLLIFIIIALSLLSFFLGSPKNIQVCRTPEVVLEKLSFWQAFAVFFPAVTGIEAGISMSGDLKNPSRSLPVGTLAAVVCGYLVYLLIPLFIWNFEQLRQYLTINPLVLKDFALVPEIVVLGIWGATLSSALGALLGAPRTLEALSKDKIAPVLFSKRFGKEQTPRIATAVSFLVALLGILLGELDLIAPILSMFFLTSYGFLNLAAGVESLLANPSWRPSFSVSWLVSLAGAFACFITMLMINPGATFIALALASLIYFLQKKRHLRAQWSDIRQGILFFLARYSVYKLASEKLNERSWKPNILVFTGSPNSRWHLIELANIFTQKRGLLISSSIIASSSFNEEKALKMEDTIREFLQKKGVEALVKIDCNENIMTGAQSIIENYGLGKTLQPNTLLIGESEKEENLLGYIKLIMATHRTNKNILIVRTNNDPQKEAQLKKTSAGSSLNRVDIWWSRQKQNAGLMIVLAYILKNHRSCRKLELNLKSLVSNKDERESAVHQLNHFLAESRISAKPEVLIRSLEEEPFSVIRRRSEQADLIFMGMRAPQKNETVEEYALYYKNLLSKTSFFPNTIFVLASEKVNFTNIFL